MVLTNELVEKIKKEYLEWKDDCEQQGLPGGINADDVFDFIKHYCKKEEAKDKLVNVVLEEHAKLLLKLYSTIVKYTEVLSNKYDASFNDTTTAIIDEIKILIEEENNELCKN